LIPIEVGGLQTLNSLDIRLILQLDDAENNPDMIGIEGAMKYLGDIGVQLDEVACFAIAELLQSPSMGEFTRTGFLAGWKSVKYDSFSYLSHLF
jgi:DCN1-like protein 1/2